MWCIIKQEIYKDRKKFSKSVFEVNFILICTSSMQSYSPLPGSPIMSQKSLIYLHIFMFKLQGDHFIGFVTNFFCQCLNFSFPLYILGKHRHATHARVIFLGEGTLHLNPSLPNFAPPPLNFQKVLQETIYSPIRYNTKTRMTYK